MKKYIKKIIKVVKLEEMRILPGNLAFSLMFLIISLCLSSKGCLAIIETSNVLYKIKDNNLIKLRIKSLLMIIILFILVSFMIFINIFGDIILDLINIDSLKIIKFPISLVLMFFLIKTLYYLAPSKKIPNKYMNKGSLFTTISWLFLLRLYSYYLNNYNNYSFYYGDISSILILLLWVYLLSYLFTLGLSINVSDYLVSKLEIEKNN